jgi:hypothetical protein
MNKLLTLVAMLAFGVGAAAFAQNTKISALANGSPAQSGDLLPIARSGANYYLPLTAIAAFAVPTVTATPGFVIGCYGPNLPPIQASGINTLGTRAANEVYVCEMWWPFGMQVGHVSTYVATAETGTFNVGLWTGAGTKVVESGPLPCTVNSSIQTSTLGSTTGSSSPVFLPPGVYYFGYSVSSTSCEPNGINPYGTGNYNLFNSVTNKFYVLSTPTSGSPAQLPTTLGSAGTAFPGETIPLAIFEP